METFIRRFEKNSSEATRGVCTTRPTMSEHSFSGLDRVIYEINQLTNSRSTCAALSREVFQTRLINVSITRTPQLNIGIFGTDCEIQMHHRVTGI